MTDSWKEDENTAEDLSVFWLRTGSRTPHAPFILSAGGKLVLLQTTAILSGLLWTRILIKPHKQRKKKDEFGSGETQAAL